MKCILAGDYNINHLNHLSNNDTGNFVNNLFDMSVLSMIERPTRYEENCATLIISYLINCDNNLSGIILDSRRGMPVLADNEKLITLKNK